MKSEGCRTGMGWFSEHAQLEREEFSTVCNQAAALEGAKALCSEGLSVCMSYAVVCYCV